MNKSYRQRVREKLARSESARPVTLPMGFRALDTATGGLLRGRIVELFGGADRGKKTLALRIIANLQATAGAGRVGRRRALFRRRVRHASGGRDGPPAGGAAQLGGGSVGDADLLVVDSAAALVPQAERECRHGCRRRGTPGRVLTSGLGRLAGAMRRSGVVALFLNQTRLGAAAEGEAGGPPLKLVATMRIAMRGNRGGRVRLSCAC